MTDESPKTDARWTGIVLDVSLAAALVLSLHGDALLSLLGYDDPILLSHVTRQAPFRYLFVPDAWQAFNWRGFYPLYLLSFDLQLRLFGLAPVSFHAYQLLLAVAGAALLALAVGGGGGGATVARGAMALLLLVPAVGTLSRQLMTRCFLEGAVLLLASACALVAGSARRSRPLVWWGAALWLLAALEKEVFVPFLLPLGLLLAFRGARNLVPLASAVAAYAGYHLWLAPYGIRVYDVEAVSVSGLVSHLASFPRALAAALLPTHGPAASFVLAGLVLLAAILTPRRIRPWALVVATAAAALAPVLLVSEVLAERHVFHVWLGLLLWLAVGLGAWLARTGSKTAIASAAGAAALLAAFLGRGDAEHTARLRADSDWYDEVFRLAFSTASPSDVLVSDTVSVHYPFIAGLNVLRRVHGDGREVPFFVTDVAALCRTSFPAGTRYWDVRGRRARLSRDLPGHAREETCSLLRPEGTLHVSITKTGGLLEWAFGPEEPGTWSLVFVEPDKDRGGPAIRFDVPPKGGAWIHEERRSARLYVQRVGADGGIVQSPDLTLDFFGDSRIEWRR